MRSFYVYDMSRAHPVWRKPNVVCVPAYTCIENHTVWLHTRIHLHLELSVFFSAFLHSVRLISGFAIHFLKLSRNLPDLLVNIGEHHLRVHPFQCPASLPSAGDVDLHPTLSRAAIASDLMEIVSSVCRRMAALCVIGCSP